MVNALQNYFAPEAHQNVKFYKINNKSVQEQIVKNESSLIIVSRKIIKYRAHFGKIVQLYKERD